MLFGSRFGKVLGRVFGGFWGSKVGFWGFEKESNFEAEVGSRKSDFKHVRGPLAGGSGGPNIDR